MKCKDCVYQNGKGCNNVAVIDSNYMGIKIDYRIGEIKDLNCPMTDMNKIYESIKKHSVIQFADNFGCIHGKAKETA